MGLTNQQDQIRACAKEILEKGQVELVIGYEVGTRGQARPTFIRESRDVDRLIWNQGCTHNLVTYLRDMKHLVGSGEQIHAVGIVVKPCDSRALNILLSEKQIEREELFVIGVVCDGILEGAGFAGGGNEILQHRCQVCSDRMPVLYDQLIGESIQIEARDDFEDVIALEEMTSAERMAFWLKQFDRCILCHACRQVCPGCYCSVCMFERDDSLWVGIASGLKEKEIFHLGRAYHLATRCVGCNECERVCPMELPLSLLNRKLAKEVQSLFHFNAGDEVALTPLSTALKDSEGTLK
jgi:ferredoxin